MQIKLNSSTLAPETKTKKSVHKTVDNLSSLVSSSRAHEFSTLDSQCSRSLRIAGRDLNHWTWRHTDWERKSNKRQKWRKKGGEKSTTGKLRGWQKSCNSATTLSCRFQHEITCWRPKSVNFSAENYPHVANSFSFARPISDSDSYYFATICTLSHASMHACTDKHSG